MIETIAKALQDYWKAKDVVQPVTAYYGEARACLEALREPSEAMLRAVDDEDSDRMVARVLAQIGNQSPSAG